MAEIGKEEGNMDMDKKSILDRLFAGNKQLPTMPELYVQFNKMIANPAVSNKKIADIIMKDQSMVTRILRLSNSAMYSRRQDIASLANAITFLGIETLKNLILQISLVREFSFEGGEVPEFKINTFWEHSLATAYFAVIIAKKLQLPANENYYIGGLLHDIGKLVIYQFYPEKFKEVILKQIKNGTTDYKAEAEIFRVNHMDIGVFFAEKWKFHEEIVEAIGDHHKSHTSLGLHVSVVRIANMLSKTAGLCFPWDNRLFGLVGDPTWEIFSNYITSEIDIQRLIDELMGESDKVRESVNELLAADKDTKTGADKGR